MYFQKGLLFSLMSPYVIFYFFLHNILSGGIFLI
jgi:hypothetical protein